MVAYATKRAVAENVDPRVVLAVINCESTWNPVAVGDGGKSHGLVQIHEGYHPDISREQAQDPRFAIDYLVSEVSEGNGRRWTCFRKVARL
jgi:soluble lytic murein transglycosylase-like protein